MAIFSPFWQDLASSQPPASPVQGARRTAGSPLLPPRPGPLGRSRRTLVSDSAVGTESLRIGQLPRQLAGPWSAPRPRAIICHMHSHQCAARIAWAQRARSALRTHATHGARCGSSQSFTTGESMIRNPGGAAPSDPLVFSRRIRKFIFVCALHRRFLLDTQDPPCTARVRGTSACAHATRAQRAAHVCSARSARGTSACAHAVRAQRAALERSAYSARGVHIAVQ